MRMIMIMIAVLLIGGAVGVYLLFNWENEETSSPFSPTPLYTSTSETPNAPSPTHSLEAKSNSQGSTTSSGPRISNVFPNPIAGGQIIIVSGSGFGSATGTVKLFGPEPFNSGECAIQTWSSSDIHCTLPNNMVAGSTHSVQVVTADGSQSSQRNLSIE